MTELDTPTPLAGDLGDGEVLLRMIAGGICGSDIPRFTGATGSPLDADASRRGDIGAPMHEVVGEVVASRSSCVQGGQRVVGWANRSNALAEVVITRGDHLWEWAAPLSATQAVVAQPLACVIEALARVDVSGRDVAVIGLGPIGLLFAHVARQSGARTVVGVDPLDRSALAEDFGLDRAVVGPSGAWRRTLTSGRPQVVVEAVGHQPATLQHALSAVADEGTVLCFGIPDEDVYALDVERIIRGRLTLKGAVTRRHRAALRRADEYLRLHPQLPARLISHQFGRGQVQAAFEHASQWATSRLKVVVDFAQDR
jgi:threonine dehydrogenase-like Zn-dependent dehydrogenase